MDLMGCHLPVTRGAVVHVAFAHIGFDVDGSTLVWLVTSMSRLTHMKEL